MNNSRTYVLILVISVAYSAESSCTVKKITGSIGTALETPNWSVEEQTLYFIDFNGNTFYRLNGETGIVTSGNIGSCGTFGLIMPLKGSPPGYVIVAIKSSLYIMNCNAPIVKDSLRRIITVEDWKPDNIIHEGKVDAAGRLWFGTIGKPLSALTIEMDQASLYVLTNETYSCPRVALRPVSLSDGSVWSLNNDKFYYNDGPTRRIDIFDFNLKKGEIANRTTFFDFIENNITGFPNGMAIDSDGHIWVATYYGAEVLRIHGVTGRILLKIKLPVDQVASLTWGGKNLDDLFVVTGKYLIQNPKNSSGSVFRINIDGCRGVAPNYMRFEGIENY